MIMQKRAQEITRALFGSTIIYYINCKIISSAK